MVLVNTTAKEMTAKVVYYGPGLCGKTTNLIQLHELLPAEKKGKMLSLATKQDRTLFFDLLPVDAGTIKGMKVRIQLYTVPGQVFYNETRKLVLKGVDAVVFVADSQKAMLDANKESFKNLFDNLKELDIESGNLPLVVQLNKRDLSKILPPEDIIGALGASNYPYEEAIAIEGKGVKETFHLILRLLLSKLAGKKDIYQGLVAPSAKKVPKKKEAPAEATSLEDTSPGREPSVIPVEEVYESVEEVDLTQLLQEKQSETMSIKKVSAEEEVEELTPASMISLEETSVSIPKEAIQPVVPSPVTSKSAEPVAQEPLMEEIIAGLKEIKIILDKLLQKLT